MAEIAPFDPFSQHLDEGARREPPHARLTAEAKLVRGAIAARHSDKFLRLFEFLVARTIEGRPPTEAEIASEVFSIQKAVGGRQDAVVRVCVHRLRKAMDAIYAGHHGPRLLVPKGEYSIVLTEEGAEPEAGPAVEPSPDRPEREPFAKTRWLALAALAAATAVVLSMFLIPELDFRSRPLETTTLWHPVATGHRPTTVVLGDYYMFAQASGAETDPAAPPRLVRDLDINAREDLDVYLMRHPQEAGKFADLDEHYAPSSAVVALDDVFTAMHIIKRDGAFGINLISASQLTAEILKSSDIVYVGPLSGLGSLLRNPLFQASEFKVGDTYDQLIDSRSGKLYQSDGAVITDERIPRRDYGYLARLPGPSGNTIVIIAGTRDPGLLEMAELASDPERLAAITTRSGGGSDGFEALYQVRTMGNLNLGSKLLVRRLLRSRGIWDKSGPSQRFPHDAYEGGGHAGQ